MTNKFENKVLAIASIIVNHYLAEEDKESFNINDIKVDEIYDNQYNYEGKTATGNYSMEFLIMTDEEAEKRFYEEETMLFEDLGFEGCDEWVFEDIMDYDVLGELVRADLSDVFSIDTDYLYDYCKDNRLFKVSVYEHLREELLNYFKENGSDNDINDVEDYDEDELLNEYIRVFSEDVFIDKYFDTCDYEEIAIDYRMSSMNYSDYKAYFVDIFGYGKDFYQFCIENNVFSVDDIIEHIKNSDSRGNIISSYDGYEREVFINDESYYVYRIN